MRGPSNCLVPDPAAQDGKQKEAAQRLFSKAQGKDPPQLMPCADASDTELDPSDMENVLLPTEPAAGASDVNSQFHTARLLPASQSPKADPEPILRESFSAVTARNSSIAEFLQGRLKE